MLYKHHYGRQRVASTSEKCGAEYKDLMSSVAGRYLYSIAYVKLTASSQLLKTLIQHLHRISCISKLLEVQVS